MKISTQPRSSKTPEREESPLVGSALLSEVQENGHSEIRQIIVPAESNQSIVFANASGKTDFKDSDISYKLCRSKRVSCQDTIPESDEDNRDNELTMERVGRLVISVKL